ncbi:kinase-like protein [Lizonia empirigonia]|nr:kinase-like protein [Lizonia empirigonia]
MSGAAEALHGLDSAHFSCDKVSLARNLAAPGAIIFLSISAIPRSTSTMGTEMATQTGEMRIRVDPQRSSDRQRPVMSSKTLALRRRGTMRIPTAQLQGGEEDELDFAGELPTAMATVFGPTSSRPKLNTRTSSRRSLGSAHGAIISGPSSMSTPLTFHTARSSASYFTASLEILEDRSAWLMDLTENGVAQNGKSKTAILKNTDRWLQTLQTLKRLGLDTIEDPKKLKEAYFHYVCDAMRRNEKVREAIASRVLEKGPVFSSEWMKHLDARGILTNELDWSGRGEHVEYTSREESNIPLRSEKILGHGQSAIVECVRCRRIRLARKTIFCSRSLKKTEAISEVEHLHKLRHSHIVRVVGTYTIGKRLAILLYPAARWSLAEFFDEVDKRTMTLKTNLSHEQYSSPKSQAWIGVQALVTFFGCISNAVSFIHAQNVRHMDFKPGNLLVQPTEPGNPIFSSIYRVYIADFGIARAYKTVAESETESRIPMFTPRYAAPEVVEQEKRGFSSDIFSIGCVFMEMMAIVLSCSRFNERRRLTVLLHDCETNSDSSSRPYHTSIEIVRTWFEDARARYARHKDQCQVLRNIDNDFLDLLPKMLHPKPEHRPNAKQLELATRSLQCAQCNSGPEPFEAVDLAGNV